MVGGLVSLLEEELGRAWILTRGDKQRHWAESWPPVRTLLAQGKRLLVTIGRGIEDDLFIPTSWLCSWQEPDRDSFRPFPTCSANYHGTYYGMQRGYFQRILFCDLQWGPFARGLSLWRAPIRCIPSL